MASEKRLIRAVRDGLAAVADPDRAPAMRAYMKSAMPYLGVPKPTRSAVVREAFAANPLPDRASYEETVQALWRGASFREERYAAIDLTGYRAYRGHQDVDALPLYDEMVVTGAWWDYVDEVASRRVGPILRGDPSRVTPVLRGWARDPVLWRRRVAIIAQLGSREATDTDLLAYAVDANLSDPEFFIRKAIGWALREHTKTDPAWVRHFVATRAGLMAPLSRREALRLIEG